MVKSGDCGETRVYAIGLVEGLEITVIYTDRNNDERRIISAWRSEPHERHYHWQNSKRKLTTDWEALRTMCNSDIHAGIEAGPDAHVTDEDFWKKAEVVHPKPKQPITVRP